MDEWNDLKNETDSCDGLIKDPKWVSRKIDHVVP